MFIVFREAEGVDESQKSGGQEVFVGGGMLYTTVVFLEAWWLGGFVGSDDIACDGLACG